MSVDKSDSHVRAMFGQIAPRYDLLNHVLSLNIDRYWRYRTVRLVPPQGDGPILDLCTGTGDLAFAYQRRSTGQAPVIGADFCREMLQIGEQKKRRRGVNGQVMFVEADAQALPFADDSFQIVSVAFGLRNVADTDRGLAEMHRVCRPGGQVAVLEFSKPRVPPLSTFYTLYFRHVLPRIGAALSRSQAAYTYLPQSVCEFPDGLALAQRLRDAGLRDVWFRPFTLGVATLYVGTK